jgi:hypothetical protein
MSVVYLSQVSGFAGGQSPAVTAYNSAAGAPPSTTFPGGITATVGTPWESPATPGTYGVAITLSAALPLGTLLYVGWNVGGARIDDPAPICTAGILGDIDTTAPTGPASDVRQMLIQVWRKLFAKVVKDEASGTIKTYADDGTTVVTTQPYTDDGAGNVTLGAAT